MTRQVETVKLDQSDEMVDLLAGDSQGRLKVVRPTFLRPQEAPGCRWAPGQNSSTPHPTTREVHRRTISGLLGSLWDYAGDGTCLHEPCFG